MPVLLLPGIGVGTDAWASSIARGNDRGFACDGASWRTCADARDGSVLLATRRTGAGRRMEVCRGKHQRNATSQGICAGVDVIARVATFFDLDGTLIPGPSLEKRLLRILHRQGLLGFRN